MFNYAEHLTTPQSEALPGQVENSAGGFSFPLDDWKRLDRFLILGSEAGSYYASPRTLTRENAKVIERCLKEDGDRVVKQIVEISDAGRAPKNDPALFALALAAKLGDECTRRLAFEVLPKVARIGTHLFYFVAFLQELGGWGRATKRGFAKWYTNMPEERLVLQAIKYQSRDGWSHRDLLRLAHPTPATDRQKAIFHWIVKGWDEVGQDPHPDEILGQIWAFERAKTKPSMKELIRLIVDYHLPHECVPTESKNDPAVWDAMLPSMGLTALVRNLGKMTSIGLLAPFSTPEKLVVERFGDFSAIKNARLHPISILTALKTYGQGHGDKGKLSWKPNQRIVDALDSAFYLAFKAIEPTGKRHLLALDVSGSMDANPIANMNMSTREGSAAMALVTANVESESLFVGFSAGPYKSKWGPGTSGIRSLAISPRQRISDVTFYLKSIPFGGTDCALPMLWAADQKIPVDVFCIYTDNETWAGDVHPTEALERYRQKMGIGAKLVVIGMVANEFSIADPKDAGMLDLIGFDTSCPALIGDFARKGFAREGFAQKDFGREGFTQEGLEQ
jgi:60 kDa SS-A/Ro ribonucleoprotein